MVEHLSAEEKRRLDNFKQVYSQIPLPTMAILERIASCQDGKYWDSAGIVRAFQRLWVEDPDTVPILLWFVRSGRSQDGEWYCARGLAAKKHTLSNWLVGPDGCCPTSRLATSVFSLVSSGPTGALRGPELALCARIVKLNSRP
jgi:hypothetical protein